MGIFRVPAGTHTFTVNATAPFLLTVNAPEPLWTPRYALHASWRTLRLYADDYTLAQIYAAAAPFHPASCPKICTRADIPMAEAADGAAPDPPGTIARIGPVGGEQLVDTGGDELYDVIRLSVPLVVTRTGDYALAGELVDTTGRTLASDAYESPYAEPLCTGVHTISFTFGAQSIRGFAVDGPYTLTALTLDYVDPTTFEHRPIEKINNAYSTRAYSWTLFEGGGSAPTARENRDLSDQRTTPPSLR